MSMRHNKKRNTALLYEFLMRHISKCVVEQKKDEVQKAVSVLKKHFAANTPLGQDLKLFNAVAKNTFRTRESASKVVSEMLKKAKEIDPKKLDDAKSRLIREINYVIKSPTIYEYKIPNYVVYASVQILLNEARSKKTLVEFVDKAKLEETVVDFLLKEDKNPSVEQLKKDPNYSNAVYKFCLKRFNEKYDNTLSENQKKLLTKYAIYLLNEEKKPIIKSAIEKEVESVKNKLRIIKDEKIRGDSDLMKKLNECYKKLVSSDFGEINDKTVLEVMQYMSLAEEVNS